MKSRLKFKNAFVIFIIATISLYSLAFIVKAPFSSLPSGKEDVLVTRIINQNIAKIPHSLNDIFQGNIFFPYKNTMVYSVMLLPSSIISYFPVKIFDSHILGFNFTLITSQILSMFCAYLFFKDITNDRFSSLLGAVTLCLSQIHMQFMTHVQTFIMQWWLISIWMVWKFSESFTPGVFDVDSPGVGDFKYLYIAGIFTAIQFWENPLGVFWIAFISLAILGSKVFGVMKGWKKLAPLSIVVFLLCFPLLKAYYSVSNQFGYVRPIREVAHFSMSVNDLWGRNFSPGLYGLFIVSLAMSFWRSDSIGSIEFLKINRQKYKIDNSYKNAIFIFALTSILGLIMSLGPVLKWQGQTVRLVGEGFQRKPPVGWNRFEPLIVRFGSLCDNTFIPLPYGIFYYLLPGFKSMRAPSLWILVFAFGLSGIITMAFSRYKSKGKNVLVVLALVLAVVGGRRLEKSVKVPAKDQYPKVYSWLGEQEGKVILELPVYTWVDGDVFHREMYRMLYSLKHGKKLVSGASGFIPPERQNLISELKDFPSEDLESKLREIGVNYIVIHSNEYEKEGLEAIELWGVEKVIFEDDKNVVYRLRD